MSKPIDPVLLTQADIDELLIKMKETILEENAQKKIKAKNKAFDHFLETGEIIEERPIERFFDLNRVGQFPEIDFDIVPYPPISVRDK